MKRKHTTRIIIITKGSYPHAETHSTELIFQIPDESWFGLIVRAPTRIQASNIILTAEMRKIAI